MSPLLLLACAGRFAIQPPETGSWDVDEKDQIRIEVIEAYLDTGSCDRALHAISSVRNDGMQGPTLDLLQARAMICMGLPTDALILLEGRYERNPERNRVLCVAHMDLGNVEAAQAACAKAIKYTPRDTDADRRAELHNNYGFTLAAQGRHDEAIQAYQEALRLDPDMHRARNNYAFSLAAMGQDDQAWEQFLAAQSPLFGPENAMANAWLNLGLAQQGRGDMEDARSSFHKALALVPDHPRANDALSTLE